jgi:excisionase family DNA binding protein
MAKLLTLIEAAERLRTPPATLRYWRHMGTGPASFKLGRRVLYAEQDVEAWLESVRTLGSGKPAA